MLNPFPQWFGLFTFPPAVSVFLVFDIFASTCEVMLNMFLKMSIPLFYSCLIDLFVV